MCSIRVAAAADGVKPRGFPSEAARPAGAGRLASRSSPAPGSRARCPDRNGRARAKRRPARAPLDESPRRLGRIAAVPERDMGVEANLDRALLGPADEARTAD